MHSEKFRSFTDEHVIQSKLAHKNENLRQGIEGTAVNAENHKSMANLREEWHGEIIHADTTSGDIHKENTQSNGSSQGINVASLNLLKKTRNIMGEKTSESQLIPSAEVGLNLTKNQTTNSTEIKSNSTRLLRVLEKVKRELDEVMATWKNQHRHFFENFSKAFVEDRLQTEKLYVSRILGIHARLKKRSVIQSESGFSKEILRRIEGLN